MLEFMKTIIILVLVVFSCVLAQPGGSQNYDNLFQVYAGTDSLMQRNEFDRFWLHFDDNGDNQVTKQEFDNGWTQEGLPEPQNASLYFLELDRVADEVLNSLDFPHMFYLFDENRDGTISEREAHYKWNAYFE